MNDKRSNKTCPTTADTIWFPLKEDANNPTPNVAIPYNIIPRYALNNGPKSGELNKYIKIT